VFIYENSAKGYTIEDCNLTYIMNNTIKQSKTAILLNYRMNETITMLADAWFSHIT